MTGDTQIFGLENFGNTCYCNSVIQALYNTRPFREYILSLAPEGRTKRRVTPGSKPHPALAELSAQQQHALNSKLSEPSSPSGQRSGLSALRSKFSKNPPSQSNHHDSGNAPPASATASVSSFASSHGSSPLNQQETTPGAASSYHHHHHHQHHQEASFGPTPLVGFLDDSNGPMSPGSTSVSSSPPTSAGGSASSPPNAFSGVPTNNSSTASAANGSQGEQESLIDIRKRNALLRGPIANVDQSFCSEYDMKETLVTSLIDLFESIGDHESCTGVASPSRLVEVLKSENDLFRSSMHQDAQEFFNFLLNRVIEEEDKNVAANGGVPPPRGARSLFAGELTNEMRCLFCETVTRRNEPFYDFSLETLPNTSVFHCLQRFSGSEVLGANNKFYCDVCGGHQEALKRMKVRKAPPILLLHLKRFKFSEDEQRNTKLLHRVLYTKYLRLPITTDDCSTPEKLYELTSVIVHLGGGPYQGHYVVVSRTPRGWLLYDDEIVDYVDESFVYRFFGDRASLSTAYLLIYQEVSEIEHERTNTEVPNQAPASMSFSSNIATSG